MVDKTYYNQAEIDAAVQKVRALAPEYFQHESDGEIVLRTLRSAGFFGRMAARATLERNKVMDELEEAKKTIADLNASTSKAWKMFQDQIAESEAAEALCNAKHIVKAAIENPGVRSALYEQNFETSEQPRPAPDRFVPARPQFDYQIVASFSVLNRAFVVTRNGGIYEGPNHATKWGYIYQATLA